MFGYTLRRRFSTAPHTFVTLKPLPYSMNALEPVISENLMNFHYSKHHQAYVNNFNALLNDKAKAEKEGDYLKVTNLTNGLMFNGGGNYNHTFFWESLGPVKDHKDPTGDL